MLTELAVAAVSGAIGALAGRTWAYYRVASIVTRLHGVLDLLEDPAPVLDTRPIPFTVAPGQAYLTDPDLVLDRKAAGANLTDRMDLEAFTAYQAGLQVWDQPAVDRLLAAIREVPTCEVHEDRKAGYIITWQDVDHPGGTEFLVCQECRDEVPGGVAKVERLSR